MRINEIDILKGILIFLVVLGHSDFGYAREIYWFHMPGFFMVSGLLFNPDKVSREVIPFLKKKTIALLIPYMTFLISFSIISAFLFGTAIIDLKYLAKLIFGGKLLVNEFGVFWFITSLLFTFYFFTFFLKKSSTKYVLFLFILVCFIAAHVESHLINNKNYDIYFPLNIDTAFMGVVYFYLGFEFKSYYSRFKIAIIQFRYFAMIISSIAILSTFFSVIHFDFDMKYQNYGNVFYSLFIPITITLSLLTLIIALPKINVIQKALILMGRYSLMIMYLHLLIKYALFRYETYNLILFLILSIILPIILSKVSEQNKYAAFLFLGDTNKIKLKP